MPSSLLDRLHAALADRYTVERELGRGGMASVWLGRDLRHDRPVAIKVLHPELAGAIGVDRFLREIRLTAHLQHPNIVPVLDSGLLQDADGTVLPWYAMAYIPGESLRARLERERHLPVEQALRIIEGAAAALTAAHRQGVVHRDIKPENLLVAGDQVYVADFGIAKAVIETAGERLTSTGLALGTPVYMSPEQAAAQPVDARSDQYSLASVLYEMLAGEPPFTGPTAQAVVARRLAETPRPVRTVRPSVPPEVEAAMLRALERIPGDRFPDVAGFAAALRRQATDSAIPARRRPLRILQVLGVALLLGALAAGGWRLSHRQDAAPPARDPEVVALYRRGVRSYDLRSATGAREGIAALREAVARDSTYTEAWSALARAYVRAAERRFVVSGAAHDSLLRLAVSAVDRALAGDRPGADVWVTRAVVLRNVDPTDVAPALRDLRHAIALDSSDAPAWHFLAVSLAETGDMDGAMSAWRRSVAADPTYTMGLAFLGQGHYWQQRYDSAAHWADSALAVDPTYLLGRTTSGQIAVERGDFPRARAAFEAAQRLSTDIEEINALAGIGLVAARAGARGEARDLLRRADSLTADYVPAPLHTAVYLAHTYAAMGEPDQAVAWLRRFSPAANLHFQLHLRCDPPFEAIAGDSGFRSLLLTPRPPHGCV
ncbi:MAG TPA: protein kinase [Gemmatimonadales bacterium]|nr:protein kinase [Gemmatimonadales bacterium]